MLFILFIGCCSSSKIIDYSKPLINVYGKIINRQYIEFLELKDLKYEITCYAYYINIKKNIVVVRKVNSRFYDQNSDYINVNHYFTSEQFSKHVSTWCEKYYNAIHPNFLNMENREKMQVLDSLSKVPENPPVLGDMQ